MRTIQWFDKDKNYIDQNEFAFWLIDDIVYHFLRDNYNAEIPIIINQNDWKECLIEPNKLSIMLEELNSKNFEDEGFRYEPIDFLINLSKQGYYIANLGY